MRLDFFLFADARRATDCGQLGHVAGLLFEKLSEGTVFHAISWSSHESRRPVKSVGSAETLAAKGSIDEGKFLAKAFSILLGIDIQLSIVVDSKKQYATLPICRNASGLTGETGEQRLSPLVSPSFSTSPYQCL